MDLKLKNYSLSICGFVSKCRCKCNHCLLSSGSNKNQEIAFSDLRRIAEKFIGFRDEKGINVQMSAYCSCEYGNLSEEIEVNKKLKFPLPGYLNLNGTEIRKGKALREWVKYLKEIGLTNANLSWFGMENKHDVFVNRKGYFNYLIDLSRALSDENITVSNSIFIMQSNLKEITELIDVLAPFDGSNGYYIADYRGYAKKLEQVYLRSSDLNYLPNKVIEADFLENYLSEAEWIDKVRLGEYPKLKNRIMFLTCTPDNIGTYEAMTWDDTLMLFEKIDMRLQHSFDSFEFLAEIYGDRDSDIIYSFRSIIWKWLDLHFEANPTLDKNLLFSDSRSSVFWK